MLASIAAAVAVAVAVVAVVVVVVDVGAALLPVIPPIPELLSWLPPRTVVPLPLPPTLPPSTSTSGPPPSASASPPTAPSSTTAPALLLRSFHLQYLVALAEPIHMRLWVLSLLLLMLSCETTLVPADVSSRVFVRVRELVRALHCTKIGASTSDTIVRASISVSRVMTRE